MSDFEKVAKRLWDVVVDAIGPDIEFNANDCLASARAKYTESMRPNVPTLMDLGHLKTLHTQECMLNVGCHARGFALRNDKKLTVGDFMKACKREENNYGLVCGG